jgi:hypothetical protein
MAGRTHERERTAASVDGSFERDERRTDAARCAFVRARIDDRIAGDELRDVAGFQRRARAAHEFDVRRRVDARDLVGTRDARVEPFAQHPAPLQFLRRHAHAIG